MKKKTYSFTERQLNEAIHKAYYQVDPDIDSLNPSNIISIIKKHTYRNIQQFISINQSQPRKPKIEIKKPDTKDKRYVYTTMTKEAHIKIRLYSKANGTHMNRVLETILQDYVKDPSGIYPKHRVPGQKIKRIGFLCSKELLVMFKLVTSSPLGRILESIVYDKL